MTNDIILLTREWISLRLRSEGAGFHIFVNITMSLNTDKAQDGVFSSQTAMMATAFLTIIQHEPQSARCLLRAVGGTRTLQIQLAVDLIPLRASLIWGSAPTSLSPMSKSDFPSGAEWFAKFNTKKQYQLVWGAP